METREAIKLARIALVQHGLNAKGWHVKLDNARRRCGQCRYAVREISLSRNYVRLNSVPDVMNTILHEIAHALAGPGVHHGPLWRSIAVRIGSTGERCASQAVKMPKRRFKGKCRKCGIEFERDLRVRNATHKRCGKEGVIEWTRNGKPDTIKIRVVGYDFAAARAKYHHLVGYEPSKPKPCVIKCVVCGAHRFCKPQDVFQVKKCLSCRAK